MYMIRGTYQDQKNTFIKTKIVTGAISQTIISHEERDKRRLKRIHAYDEQEQDTIRISKEYCTIISATESITTTEKS